MTMQDFAQFARKLFDIQLTNQQLSALQVYERELLEWNKRINLTAIDEPAKIRIKHFLDSLACLVVMRKTTCERVIDVGTGAGFPGIPLKIVNPKMQLTLVDSVGKKVKFCQHIVNTLGLENVTIIQERAETLGQSAEHREQYDWALARAVAIMPVLSEYILPLVRVGGKALAMKGETGPAEAHTAENAIRMLGGHLHRLVPVILPGIADERYLIVIDKIAATPREYPRRVGIPAKKPLHKLA